MNSAASQSLRLIRGNGPPPSLLDAFHRINSVLPEDQVIEYVEADTTVGHALALMREHNFSQVPVLAGSHVLGVFSYRSFGRQAADLCAENVNIGELTVDEFVEPLAYAGVYEDLPKSFDALDRDNATLVGSPDNLIGILTPLDVLRYLYDVASPFVLIAEIEQTLRRIILVCCSADEFAACINNSLKKVYGGNPPDALEDMTFNDYVQLIGDGRNWKLFAPAFGAESDFQRKRTRGRLEEIRDLRNDVFHFKRDIGQDDRLKLAEHRTWLWRKALKVHARQQESNG